MATTRKWTCSSGCEKKARNLFDALRSIAEHTPPSCKKHGREQFLALEFPFALGVTNNRTTVLAAFLPDNPEEWETTDGLIVTFYPFLVVVRRHGRKTAYWLPYWHLIQEPGGDEPTKKYGQWAPFMDDHLFHSLLRKAQSNGYLDEGRKVV